MCLGIPGRVTARTTDHADLATVDVAGVERPVNVGMLDQPVRPGDWVLLHMGFALSTMTPQEAEDALRFMEGQATQDEDLALGPDWATPR